MLVVAYIGFGNSVCRYHLPYVERRKDTIKVKYIYRRVEDRIGDEERETWYPHITFTSDLDEVMNDQEVNLIVVNTPDGFHTYYTKMAIEHGKNCLCEKPFAKSVKEAKEVFDLAKEKGVVVMANQNRRFDADMRTVRKVIETSVLGELLEIESHYDYYRPSIANRKGLGMLYGLQVHPIDQIVGEFGTPDKVVCDCRSFDNLGNSDDYSDIDLYYGKMKAIIKTSFYVKLEYPRFIVHGRKGSFIMPQLGHQSALKSKPGPVEISFDPLPEKYWGTLCYEDENGNDITKKIPVEIQDYGMIYDNLYDVIFNHGQKVVADEEVLEVLRILEKATEVAKRLDKMRLGIAGAGMIVRGLFSFIHEIEGIELEAIASTEKSIEKVKQMAKENHVKKAYLNYDELLNDEDIEVMYIATPNHLHYQMCKQALEKGKNVICEKPFTSRIEELEELSQLAKEKHLFLFEAISTQYLPNVLKIKEKLNELGNIKIVTANYSQYSSRYNAFKEGIIQPAFDYTKSGGALMDLNIYNIHLMVALFGKPLKVNYMANIEKNIDTSGIITLDYGNFKAVLIGAKDCKAPIATSIQGDQGCISIQTPANVLRSFKILHNDQREEEFDLQGDTHRMVYEFNEFVKMIENKDSDRANEMMEKSLIAMDIATKARIDAGVHFKADESYE